MLGLQFIQMLLVYEIMQIELRLLYIVSIIIHPAKNVFPNILLNIYSDKTKAAFIDMGVCPIG